MFIQPFHLVLSALADSANREQAAIIDYLRDRLAGEAQIHRR